MNIERRKKNQFHIKDEEALFILKEVLGEYDFTEESIRRENASPEKDTKDPAIRRHNLLMVYIASIMFTMTLIFPVFLVFFKAPGPKIDPERLARAQQMADVNTYDTSVLTKGQRDNTPLCLVPTADGTTVYGNDLAYMDASNISEGYIVMRYTGTCSKVKLRITGPDDITYTYNMAADGGKEEVFPLQAGNGHYLIGVFENITETQYATAFSQEIDVNITDEFTPFLYPNQYIEFTKDNQAVAYAEYLSYTADTDLDVVNNIYNALISSMTYDYEEAQTVESGYIPEIDEVLTTGTGICIDYAALMTSMLRSQRIPTRMEIGYAGTAYHAWLSTYIHDIGWVNGMIRFDGKEWSLMDPTFASTTDTEKLANFIGDGANYRTKYIY